MRSLFVVAAASAAALVPVGLASTATPAPTAPVTPAPATPVTVRHRPPVDVPVVGRFRPPATPFGPGNRGIDYATEEGSPVRASADGVVDFAGPVGGRLHVVIRHADGIRTSYSFLASIAVHAGQRVAGGTQVGTAGRSLHFGARRGDAYIDPLSLFGGPPARVHLVADEPGRGGR